MKNYGKFVTGLIAAWFILAVCASALHLFENGGNRVGAGVGIAALAPIVLFSLCFAVSESFRQFTLSFSFVLLEARGVLPAIFALPAGYGDMAIGATAAFVAWKLVNPRHRNSFIVWQVLGITDLVLAVALGTTASLLSPHGATTAAMTVLPLSLVPTFLVPLYIISHVICIAQARSWKAASEGASQTMRPAQYPAI
jgi:hypothetical protein